MWTLLRRVFLPWIKANSRTAVKKKYNTGNIMKRTSRRLCQSLGAYQNAWGNFLSIYYSFSCIQISHPFFIRLALSAANNHLVVAVCLGGCYSHRQYHNGDEQRTTTTKNTRDILYVTKCSSLTLFTYLYHSCHFSYFNFFFCYGCVSTGADENWQTLRGQNA